METGFFPLFIDIKGKRFLVVGAGRIAERRIRILLDFGCNIRVVAPEACAGIQACEKDGLLVWIRRNFLPEDVDDTDFVLAATDDETINDYVAVLCRAKKIWVNHAGKKESCDFFFPGIARKGSLVAGVTDSGKDHKLTKRVAEAIRQMLEEII